MYIVVLCGGSGAANLQTSLQELLPHAEVSFLVNAYDDGLSTAAVRAAAGCLGPSDVRKNHVRLHELKHGCTEIARLFAHRLTEVHSWADVRRRATARIMRADVDAGCKEATMRCVHGLCDAAEDRSAGVSSDMAMGNLFYAGRSLETGFAEAMRFFEDMLQLRPLSVILNSDENLQLSARCADGSLLPTEASIVQYLQPEPRIVSLHLKDPQNDRSTRPRISEEARKALTGADLCIVAPGTQMSSIIPTLMTEGLVLPRGLTYFVMNAGEDGGQVGLAASDILAWWASTGVWTGDQVVCFASADPAFGPPPSYTAPYLVCHDVDLHVHCGNETLKLILRDFVRKRCAVPWRVAFDWDGTLSCPRSAELTADNVLLLESLSAETHVLTGSYPTASLLSLQSAEVHCVFGMLDLNLANRRADSAFGEETAQHIMRQLTARDVPFVVLNNCCVRIKPVAKERRAALVLELQRVMGEACEVRSTGRTTIDITLRGSGKDAALRALSPLTYVAVDEADYHEPGVDHVTVRHAAAANCWLRAFNVERRAASVGVILAAGKSARFGGVKAATVLPGGETVLERLIRMLLPRVDFILLAMSSVTSSALQVIVQGMSKEDSARIRTVVFPPTADQAQSFSHLAPFLPPNRTVILCWSDVVVQDPRVLDLTLPAQVDALVPCESVERPYVCVELSGGSRSNISAVRPGGGTAGCRWHDLGVFYLSPKAARVATEAHAWPATPFKEPSVLNIFNQSLTPIVGRILPMDEGATLSFNTREEAQSIACRIAPHSK